MAYQFLTEVDIRVSVRDLILTEISDDDTDILERAERQSIDKAKSYRAGRYDVTALFGAAMADRKPLLVEHVTNLFLYRVYLRINPRKMSDAIKEAYHESLDWLEGVAKGKFNPDFPAATGPDIPTNDPIWGGSDPLGGHYY